MRQNKVKLYARALAEVLSKPAYAEASADAKALADKSARQGKIIDNFAGLLIKSGLLNKAKEILDLTEDLILEKEGKRKITFETARKMTAGQKKLLENFVKEGDKIQEKINPELIAGVKIIINGSKQFDASMQGKLQNIFLI